VQEHIASGMTVEIVDEFEIIEIKKEKTRLNIASFCRF
jgi:hypothetical protein